MNATATQRPRRLGHTPSADGWPTASKRRRLTTGCGREDATANLPRVRVPCDCASFPGDDCLASEWARAKRAMMGTLGVGGTGGLGGHSRCGCDGPRRPRRRQRPDARSGARSGALGRTQAALTGSTQAALRQHSRAIRSNHEHSVAPRRRPTPSSSERALQPPLPLTALPSSRPPFASPCAS
jgi:hypothetical protein